MNNVQNFCDVNCPHCIENIEEFGNGKGCAWYECECTGKMVEHMEECPEKKEDEE